MKVGLASILVNAFEYFISFHSPAFKYWTWINAICKIIGVNNSMNVTQTKYTSIVLNKNLRRNGRL